MNENSKKHSRTKKGLICRIFFNQKHNSISKGYPPPTYTLNGLRAWMIRQHKFHKLFNDWRISGYDKMLIPSCDRRDDYKPYTLDNLRITTWGENKQKGYDDRRNGINNKTNRAVLQLDMCREVINEFHSISEAGRVAGVTVRSISYACRNEKKRAGGFYWRYNRKFTIFSIH